MPKSYYLSKIIGVVLICLGVFVIFYHPTQYSSPTAQVSSTQTVKQDDATNNSQNGHLLNGKVDASSQISQAKSEETQERMQELRKWIATDYAKGDIGIGNYEVRRGDTLWEISEAVYGEGKLWLKILEQNKSKIGFLKNGQRALIIPGQILEISR